jgi:hypothetical protein
MKNEIFLSYLVTCKNEGFQLQFLLEKLYKYNDKAECVILDDHSDDIDTLSILQNAETQSDGFFRIFKHNLNNNYSEHKNWGKSKCLGKYIFQIDSDEMPSDTLLENIKDIIELNPEIELFWVPRINDFKGVNQSHADQWGWRLSDYNDIKIVNWPDPQGRIFLNSENIKWDRPLHERIEGAKLSTKLPMEFEWALYHDKTIEKQIETNLRYNKNFSKELNKGFVVQ